jgi:monoamine oxidase
VIVTTNQGVFTAKQSILTIPVSLLQASAITFDPPLSAAKRAAIAAFRTEAATKFLYRFDEPLWDELLVFAAHDGIASRWWTPGYGRPGAAVLCCYITADWAIRIDAMAEAAALHLGLVEMSRLLGRSDLAARCANARRIAWAHDSYARGGYAHLPHG